MNQVGVDKSHSHYSDAFLHQGRMANFHDGIESNKRLSLNWHMNNASLRARKIP
jgi:hypothetical protein